MYAVVATGGKQYRVTEGDILQVEKLDLDIGSTIEFNEVLLIANKNNVKIGTPHVIGAKVVAEIIAQERGEKINIIKFRRRKHHMKKQGHRQYITEIKIKNIEGLENGT